MNTSYKAIREQYVFWLETLGYSKGVVYGYGIHARDFFLWLESRGISEINRVTGRHLTAFFDNEEIRPNKLYKGAKISPSHLNGTFNAIDKLMEFLHQTGMDNAPTPQNRRIPIDEDERIRNIQPFSIDEIKTLQAQIENTYPDFGYKHRQLKHYQLKLIFTLYYACGLRLREGLKLTAQDIDFNRRTLFVRQGKNGKDRIVPLSENVCNALQDYVYNFRNLIKRGHDRLFLQRETAMLKDLRRLQSLCNDDGIRGKRLYFHILRHSIATHLLQNGMTIENISRFLGHGCLQSTQNYTHIANR
jgi:integrase/recombinase XerD